MSLKPISRPADDLLSRLVSIVAVEHVIADPDLMAPYLRGRARQHFDDLASGKLPRREFYDYLPPRDGTSGTAAAKNDRDNKDTLQ